MYQGYSEYYEGNHRLAFQTTKFRRAFGNLFHAFADNWCDLVVDATEERLTIEGFRIPSEGGLGDSDSVAWDMWQANQMDANSQVLHTEALINGCASVLVWPGDKYPTITIESPEQMIVAHAPGSTVVAAAMKEWWDDWEGYLMANVYLPDGIYKYQSTRKVRSESDLGQAENIEWVPRVPDGEDWPLGNPFGEVPVVSFENKPRMLIPGTSEIKRVIPVQDAVNKLCADLLVASEFEAFRQRWATGLEIPKDPQTGQPKEPFEHAIDRLWTTKSEGTKFGEFGVADLRNFVQGIEMFIQHIASQTRTPPHYFYLKGQFPSGESIKSAETGLVAKSRRKMRIWGEDWEKVIQLSYKAQGDSRSDVIDSETIWGDPESRSEAEHVDATMKKMTIQVPVEQLWEDLGYSPQQIEEFKKMRKELLAQQPPQLVIAGPAPDGAAAPRTSLNGA